MRKILPIFFLIAGLLLVVGASAYLWHLALPIPKADTSTPPEQVAGVKRMQLLTGPEAIASINQLHGKDFPLTGGQVAVYGENSLTLWVSETADEAAAKALTNQMAATIAQGNSPFTDEGELAVGGFSIHALSGLGQVHYYWQSRNLVVWVAADEALASQSLHELMTFYK